MTPASDKSDPSGFGPLAASPGSGFSLVACLTDLADLEGDPDLTGVDCLEVRADLVGDVDVDRLRNLTPARLLYTLRSRSEGGAYDEGRSLREGRLRRAAESYDLVDLEAERDLVPALLDRVAPERRLISWHGEAEEVAELAERLETMSEVPARLYKLVTTAEALCDAMLPLALLFEIERRDVIAFAMGEKVTFTRLIAAQLGAAVVYAAWGRRAAAPGQLSLARLRSDYGMPDCPRAERLFGLVGQPVAHSLSPRLHNAGYREHGVPALYVPFEAEHFSDFWLDVVESESLTEGLPLGGLSVTAPHKRAALAVAGASSPLAQRIESSNTLVRRDGVWEAETTDPVGVVGALGSRGVGIAGRRSAVLGCGGAGRAAAAGLEQAGARLVVVNRSEEPGRRLAERLRVPFVALEDFDPAAFELVVNATSVGSRPEDRSLVAVERLPDDAVVVDMVYSAGPTRLVEEAEARGLVAVDGREVLLHQALPQFRMMTGREMTAELGRELLGLDSAAGRKP